MPMTTTINLKKLHLELVVVAVQEYLPVLMEKMVQVVAVEVNLTALMVKKEV